MCVVVNKYKTKSNPNNLYIGRGSILGNPYTHMKGKTLAQFKVSTREEAIAKYKVYFYDVLLKDPKVLALLNTITDNTILVCFCKPLSCHGDIIQEWYNNRVSANRLAFIDWAKDKMLFSTHQEYITSAFEICINETSYGDIELINGVIVNHWDNYQVRLNKNSPQTKPTRELEGWVYKKDYEACKDNHINIELWNPIPREFTTIKIKS